jgi:hypothetical protein
VDVDAWVDAGEKAVALMKSAHSCEDEAIGCVRFELSKAGSAMTAEGEIGPEGRALNPLSATDHAAEVC